VPPSSALNSYTYAAFGHICYVKFEINFCFFIPYVISELRDDISRFNELKITDLYCRAIFLWLIPFFFSENLWNIPHK
jgi:hypothetical protein